MSVQLFRDLSRGKWLITEQAALAHLPLVASILRGKQLFNDDHDRETPEQLSERKERKHCSIIPTGKSTYSDGISLDSAPKGSIALITYHNVIIKRGDGCGNYGTEYISSLIEKAAANPNIESIIIDLDSPGGSGAAVERPSEAIREARKNKPVIVYAGNGMVASAAYWIASQADEIYATYESDEIGSIGAYVMMLDYEKFMAAEYNTKVEAVYASKSTSKNKGYRDWQSGDSNHLVKIEIDPFNELFHNAVRSGRGSKLNDEVLDGRLVMANEALSFGLIDGIKTFAQVIDRARELATERGVTNNTGTQMKALVMGKDNTIDAINAGKEATAEQIAAANTELKELGLVLSTESDIAASSDLLRSANSSNAENTRHLNAANQKNTELSASIEKVATAAGLKLVGNSFQNEAGEKVDLTETIEKIVSERNEYGKLAGVIKVDATSTDEIVDEKPYADPSLKYANEVFG